MWKRELAVDMLQQCAVGSDGLLDLFFRGFAHKSKTSVSRCKLLKLELQDQHRAALNVWVL